MTAFFKAPMRFFASHAAAACGRSPLSLYKITNTLCSSSYGNNLLLSQRSTSQTIPFLATSTSPLNSLSFASIKGVARKKLKSHSGSKHRFRFTRSGLILRWQAGKVHKNYKKSKRRLDRLSRPKAVYKPHYKSIKRSLPYYKKYSR